MWKIGVDGEAMDISTDETAILVIFKSNLPGHFPMNSIKISYNLFFNYIIKSSYNFMEDNSN